MTWPTTTGRGAPGSFTGAEYRELARRADTRVEFVKLVLVGGAVLPRIEERVRAAILEIYGWHWPHWETDFRAAFFRVMQAPKASHPSQGVP